MKRVWRKVKESMPVIPDVSDLPFRQRLKVYIGSVLAVDADPHWLALSFAFGIFFAFSPIYGTHTFCVLLLVPLFRLHLFTAVIASFLNPPFVAPLIYSFAFGLGKFLLGQWHSKSIPIPRTFDQLWQTLGSWNLIQQIFLPFFIGSTIVAASIAIATYFPIRHAITRVRKKNHEPQP